LFLAASIIVEGSLLWDNPVPLAGFYVLTLLSVAASLYHHILRLSQAVRKWRYVREALPDLLIMALMAAVARRPEALAVIGCLRVAYSWARVFSGTGIGKRFLGQMIRNPARTMVLTFVLVIATGTIILSLPRSTVDLRGAPIRDALFTATSATCVTGLVVMNTGNDDGRGDPLLPTFSLFGQVVILMLIQIGALGIMTLSTSVALMMGDRLSLGETSLLSNILDEGGGLAVARMVRFILWMTLAFEAIGAAILTLRFLPMFPGDPGTAAWYGVFHAISAFCNAGFSLFGDSMTRFRTDPVVMPTISALILLGGLGFSVVASLFSRRTWSHGPRRGWQHLPVHARLVLATTAGLLVGGTVVILSLDSDGALKGLPAGERILAAAFQSISARTAGFNTVDIGATARTAVFAYLFLMFVGASPGGTGGGIKTTTFALLLLSVRATLRGRNEVEVFGRTVPHRTVFKVAVITLLSFGACLVISLLLLSTQARLSTEEILFEVTSAFGTVGLSMGATRELDTLGRLLITLLMFIGRLGPLTMTLAIGQMPPKAVRYPEGRVLVG
jgi:trk system potassium uptake protein TrkH